MEAQTRWFHSQGAVVLAGVLGRRAGGWLECVGRCEGVVRHEVARATQPLRRRRGASKRDRELRTYRRGDRGGKETPARSARHGGGREVRRETFGGILHWCEDELSRFAASREGRRLAGDRLRRNTASTRLGTRSHGWKTLVTHAVVVADFVLDSATGRTQRARGRGARVARFQHGGRSAEI